MAPAARRPSQTAARRPSQTPARRTKAKLSYEEARKHFDAQLPHRIDAPNQALGFRKARQGEAISAETGKEAELYPLCSSTMLEELDSFGVGISLYFRQLLALFAVAALCALILLTSGLYNANTCDSDKITSDEVDKGGRDLDYRQGGTSTGSAAGCLRTDLSGARNVAPDIAVCVIMLVAALIADKMRSRAKSHVDENAQTASDYTIVIRNPPRHIIDPENYRSFFEEHVNDAVVCVTIAKDNGLLMTLMAQRFGFKRDLAEFAKTEVEELGFLGRLVQPFVYGMGLLKTPKYAQDNLEKVEKQLKAYIEEHSRVTAPPTTVFDHQGPDGSWTPFRQEDCLQIKKAMDSKDDGVVKLEGIPFEVRWGDKAVSKKMPNPPDEGMIQVNIKNDNTRVVRHREERVSEFDWHKPSRVYVTFETEAGMEHALETFETSGFRRMVSKYLGWESENTPEAFENVVLNVSRPVEPSEILWHTSHVRRSERWVRLAVSFGLTAALVVGVYYVSINIDDANSLALWVTFVNSALPVFLKAMQLMVEVHREYGDDQDSMFLKLLLSRWANTVIAAFIAYGRRSRLSATALSGVMSILLMDAFLLPVLRVFDVYDLFMRYVVGPRQPSQQDMNALWSGADWNIAERYTDIMKTLGVGLFYAAAVPYGLLVTAAALLTSFVVDHYCLLRLWAWKPDFDDQISRRAIGCIALLVFVHVLVTQYFFQNWGVYPAGAIDDDACLDDVEACFGYDPLQSSGHCLSSFLRCAPSHHRGKSWDRTPAQRLALRAYPIIGGMALAVALWRLIGIVMKRCLKEFIWGTHSHDYDKQMPVGFRDLGDEMAISAYVPTVPHPVPGEPPLIAANITGLPDDFLPLPPGKPKEFYTICNSGYMGEAPFGAVRDLAPAHMQADFHGLLKDLLHDIFGEVQFWVKENTDTDALTHATLGAMSHADEAAACGVDATAAAPSPQGDDDDYGGYGGMGCVDPDAPTPKLPTPKAPSVFAQPQLPTPKAPSVFAQPAPPAPQPVSYARPAAPRPAQPAMPLPAVPRPPPAALPPGWQRMLTADGREYFVDHNTQTTSWTRPTF